MFETFMHIWAVYASWALPLLLGMALHSRKRLLSRCLIPLLLVSLCLATSHVAAACTAIASGAMLFGLQVNSKTKITMSISITSPIEES